MTDSLWLTCVLRIAGEATPAIIIQEGTESRHQQLLRFLRTGGAFPRISPAEMGRACWSLAPGLQVDVADGLLARIHVVSVAKSVVPDVDQPVTALWMVAAAARPRVLVATAPPGLFDGDEKLAEGELYERLGQAAGARTLHGGMAEFFVDRFTRLPPLHGGGPRRFR